MLIDPLLVPLPLREVSHVAHRLSMSPQKVRKLIRDGKLPAILIDTRWRVDEADLQRFIDARRIANLQQRITTKEAALDSEFGIPPRGRDGPREVTLSPGRAALAQNKSGT